MKRVRSLIQNLVFGNARYNQKRAMILLYDLDEPHTKLYHDISWLRPSERLLERVRSVDKMSTTLWFDSREQLETLERAGAASPCCG